ncbi:MAG: ABC transporter permease [Verrucomicrobia bacterium]|nr:ABC transporter permease [Verrucomicrobiota bacterium]
MNSFAFAWRQLRKNPGFTAVAILVLTLGIGANTTLFTLINAVILRPIAGREPERLVGVYSEDTTRPGQFRGFSYPNFQDVRAGRDVFEDVFAFNPSQVGVLEGDQTRRVSSLNVSANYFSVLGAPMSLGREFLPEEEASGVPVVIVSYPWWQQNGARPEIIGQTLTINGRSFTVVGVAARNFTGTVPTFPADVFLPLHADQESPGFLRQRDRHSWMLIGRLKPGLSLEAANERLLALSQQMAEANPGENRTQKLVVARLPRMAMTMQPHDDHGQLGALSALLLTLSGAVLLIACLNLANLMLARGTARCREISIRFALGATRRTVLGQLLVEGLLLALFGSLLGLLVSAWTAENLVAALNAISPARLELDTRPDYRVVAATLGFCLLAVIFFALGPAWKLARIDAQSGLNEREGTTQSTAGRSLWAPRHLLVMGQVALSLALLVAAGLFVRGALRTVAPDLGFPLERGFYLELDGGLAGYSETRTRQVYAEVLERVRTLPGVESASLAATIPLGMLSMGEGVQRAGSPLPPPTSATSPAEGEAIGATFNVVSSDYFRTLGVRVQRGREFQDNEFQPGGTRRVALVNSILAEKLWPGEDILGRQIQFGRDGTMEVVGVVAPFKFHLSEHTLNPMVLVPFGQDFRPAMILQIRALPGMDSVRLLGVVRAELQRLDPNLPVLGAKTLQNHVETNVQVWVIRTGAGLFVALGLIALLLAVVGVYAVKAFMVACRTREIGIRMALGADRSEVVGMVLWDGLKITVLGFGLGLLLSAGLARAMRGFLFEVQPFDPWVFGVSLIALSLSAGLACWLPARRAARVDPMVALRTE